MGTNPDEEEEPIIIVFGRIGTGKSSLLNNIAQEAAFKSGIINDGKETVTKVSKRYKTHGMELVDTPGLDLHEPEEESPELCSEMLIVLNEIKKVFQYYKGKYVKLIFLASLGDKIIHESDNLLLYIINGVLGFEGNYSIIFNMVTKCDRENFNYNTLTKPYHSHVTSSFLIRPFSHKAHKRRDYIGPMSSELLGFLVDAPSFLMPEHSNTPPETIYSDYKSNKISNESVS